MQTNGTSIWETKTPGFVVHFLPQQITGKALGNATHGNMYQHSASISKCTSLASMICYTSGINEEP
jgi:hypothetical protein